MKNDTLHNYWQNEFDGHSSYMLPAEHNEYAVLRDMILGFIPDGWSLLDLGCASGGTLDWIKSKKRNIKYKGTDFAEKFMEANKKRYPSYLWEVEDCRELKEEDGDFDVVLLYDVIDGMTDWQKALDEAYRVASKMVIVLMWCDANMDDKREYMEKQGLSVLDIKAEGNIHFHRMFVGWK